MKAIPEAAAAAIDKVLRDAGRWEMTPVTVMAEPAKQSATAKPRILVRPANRATWIDHVLSVNREVLPPGIAMEIVRLMIDLQKRREEVDAAHAATLAALEPFTRLLSSTPLLCVDTDANPSTTQTEQRFSLYAKCLTGSLACRTQRFPRLYASIARTTAEAMAERQEKRGGMIAEAGSRAGALKCCPVTMRVIARNPGAWRAVIAQALEDETGPAQFHEGVMSPTTHLGGTVMWMSGSLRLVKPLPETLKIALVGRPISALVEHEFVDAGFVITEVLQRSSETTFVRTTAKPVPMGEMLKRLDVAVEEAS